MNVFLTQVRHGCQLAKQVLYSVFVQPTAYVVLSLGLLLNIIFVIICPTLINNQDEWILILMANMVTLFTVGFFCSVLGEMVANPNDRLFVLCRPLTRSIYLSVKLILALILSCLFATIISILHLIIWQIKFKNFNNVLKPDINQMVITIFTMCIFGGIFGATFRYYLKDFLTSIIVLAFLMFYCIFFEVYGSTMTGSSLNNNGMKHLNNLEYFYLPLCLLLPLSFCSIVVGYILNSKVNIGS